MRDNDQESAGDNNGGAKVLCTWMLELIKGGAVITQSEIHSSHFSTLDSEVHGTWRINDLLCRGL